MKIINKKKTYSAPELKVEEVVMEGCISAGSATIIPVNSSNQVQEDWKDGTNETNPLPW